MIAAHVWGNLNAWMGKVVRFQYKAAVRMEEKSIVVSVSSYLSPGLISITKY
jgi:hypothetical protein